MKKLESRAMLCLLLVMALVVGLCYFVAKLELKGGEWASFYANDHVFKKGILKVGSIEDRNGVTLLHYDSEGAHYAGEFFERKALSTVLGDVNHSIATGANVAFRQELISYNPVTGTGGLFGKKGGVVRLSIDKDINYRAYEALGNHFGLVSVYNYRTGDIVCLVSTPTVDPADYGAAGSAQEGAYINKVFSAKYTPGSTFKVLTTLVALENLPKMEKWTYECDGSADFEGGRVTCPSVHGRQDFYGALANSCNCAYAELANSLGAQKIKEYTEKMRLTDSYDINGIETAKGSFDFSGSAASLGWAGVGQGRDEINPLSMMVFMGAIAGEGSTALPSIIKDGSSGSVRLISAGSAKELKSMLRNNVKKNYGDENYKGLSLGAKSGTAQMGNSEIYNAWFFGYSGDYAFIVCVENGGSGAKAAGPVANRVMQALSDN